jgi:hypothetical protein
MCTAFPQPTPPPSRDRRGWQATNHRGRCGLGARSTCRLPAARLPAAPRPMRAPLALSVWAVCWLLLLANKQHTLYSPSLLLLLLVLSPHRPPRPPRPGSCSRCLLLLRLLLLVLLPRPRSPPPCMKPALVAEGDLELWPSRCAK